MKTFLITFVKTVKATVEIEAEDANQARHKFAKGDGWDNEKDRECGDVEFEKIEELE